MANSLFNNMPFSNFPSKYPSDGYGNDSPTPVDYYRTKQDLGLVIDQMVQQKSMRDQDSDFSNAFQNALMKYLEMRDDDEDEETTIMVNDLLDRFL